MPDCTFEIMDEDKLSKDDIVARCDIDITYRFVNSTKETIEQHPWYVAEIEDIAANVGFTRNHVIFTVDAELLFE